MLPLIPLALSFAPQIAKWIFGDKGSEVTKDVAVAIQTVTGADPNTAEGVAAAQAVLAGKPELVAQLQQRLAEIAAAREAEANREADARRQSELEEFKQSIADIAGARTQTTTLAASGNPLAYGSAILSGIILLAFGMMLYLIITKDATVQDTPLLNVLLGTLAAMSTQVANYWLGSSSGSSRKNELLANAQTALANSWPGPTVVNRGPAVMVGSAAEATASQSMPTRDGVGTVTQTVTTDELNARSLEQARRRT